MTKGNEVQLSCKITCAQTTTLDPAQWEISIYFCHIATAISYHSVTFRANEFCKAKLYPVHYNYHYCQTGLCCDLSHNCTQWEHCKYFWANPAQMISPNYTPPRRELKMFFFFIASNLRFLHQFPEVLS